MALAGHLGHTSVPLMPCMPVRAVVVAEQRQVLCVQAGHAWLSQHYRWGLRKLFEEERHSHAIILEDDMLFSPDFLTLFEVLSSRALPMCVRPHDEPSAAPF